MATIASADLMLNRLDFFDISAFFKVFKDCFSRFKRSHTRILTAVKHLGLVLCCLTRCTKLVCLRFIGSTRHMSVIGKCADNRKVMTKSDLKVVLVMCRRNLNNTRALCHICVLVAYNRNFLIEKRQNNVTAVKMRISRVIAVYCNRSIAEHCLGTCRCKLKLFACFLNCVEKMPEIRVFFLVLNLCI